MSESIHSVEDLFTDSGPFDESEVVVAIKPYLVIQKGTNAIFLNSKEIKTLSSELKVLVYGLAKKLLRMKELLEEEFLTAKEVHQQTGLKKGTVDPTFKKLKESGLLVGKGKYEIPNSKVVEILEKIPKFK